MEEPLTTWWTFSDGLVIPFGGLSGLLLHDEISGENAEETEVGQRHQKSDLQHRQSPARGERFVMKTL